MEIKIFQLLILSVFIWISACGDLNNSLVPEDMILSVNLSETDGLLADGRIIEVEAVIHPDAETDARKVLFTASGGSFKNAENGDLIVEAVMNSNVLTAKAVFIAPLKEGEVSIFVQMDLPDQRGNYVVDKVLMFDRSNPNSISIDADAFSVYNGFDGQINIIGSLFNSEDNAVNYNTKVELLDLYLDNSPINGKFKDSILLSNTDSKISTSYSPGYITADQTIKIVANVLDENGTYILGITDTLFIEVIEKP